MNKHMKAVTFLGTVAAAVAVALPALAAGTWTVVNPPDPPGNTGAQLNAAFAVSPAQAWAVGEARGPASGDSFNALIEEWNGSGWNIVPGANAGPASATTPLYGVSGSGPGDVWAVGQDSTTSTSLIEHWNGTQWTQVANPNGGSANLFAVHGLSANDVWAVSLDGSVTEQWDGTQWNSVPPAASIPAGFRVGGGFTWGGNSLSGVPGGPLFAVGGNSGGGNNEATILEQPQP